MNNIIYQPILEVDGNGTKYWRLNGLYHREDGPAIEWIGGFKQWFINGKRHRIDGPGIEFTDGTKWWFLDGKKYTKEEWFQQLTPEQQYNYLWNLDE